MKYFSYILFLLVFAWGLTRLAPGCYFGDCGEVLAAIFAGGIPHPTGFPAYLAPATIFAKAGRTAYWVHVLSCAAAAGVAVLLWDLVRRVLGSKATAGFAVLILLSSSTLIVHAATARVYTLNLFFVLAFLLMSRWEGSASRRALMLGLIAGAGMATHLTFLAAPVAAAAWHWKSRRSWFPHAVLFLVGVVLSASLYLWLPLRSALDPDVNWGDPDRFGRLWGYMTQAEYRNKMFSRGWEGSFLYLRIAGGDLMRGWFPLHWLAALGGLVVLARNHAPLFRAILTGSLFIILMMYAYGSERDLGVNYRYYLPAYALLSIAAAAGYRAVLEKLGVAHRRGFAVAIVLVAAMTIFSAHPWRMLSRSTESHDFGANVMKSLPKGACLILDNWADNQIYPLAYGRYLHGWRKDVTFLEWGGKLFPEAPREIRRRGDPNPAPLLSEWMMKERRPFFLAEAAPLQNGFVLRQEGFLYRMGPVEWVAASPPPPPPDLLFRERTHRPLPPDREGEETWIMPLLVRARWAWGAGDRLEALRHLKELRQVGAHSAPALGNAAILCMEMGERLQAQGFLAEAARYQPSYVRKLTKGDGSNP